jgi:ribosome biogenesis GTPase A
MHKALKEIKEALSQVDILIEVLDARIPYSSENP